MNRYKHVQDASEFFQHPCRHQAARFFSHVLKSMARSSLSCAAEDFAAIGKIIFVRQVA
jgi:hypothetical protein